MLFESVQEHFKPSVPGCLLPSQDHFYVLSRLTALQYMTLWFPFDESNQKLSNENITAYFATQAGINSTENKLYADEVIHLHFSLPVYSCLFKFIFHYDSKQVCLTLYSPIYKCIIKKQEMSYTTPNVLSYKLGL